MTIWRSPTSFVDPGSTWNNETKAYDGNTGTQADSNNVSQYTQSDYLELHIDSLTIDYIRIFAPFAIGGQATCTIGLYYDGGWNGFYSGLILDLEWYERAVSPVRTVTAARIRFLNMGSAAPMYLNEFSFGEYEPPPAPPPFPKPLTGQIGNSMRYQPLKGPTIPILR